MLNDKSQADSPVNLKNEGGMRKLLSFQLFISQSLNKCHE
jgi:hypothetical protein